MLQTEVLRVELVGPAWETWAAVAAVIISLATLAWTAWTRSRDRARLKVVVTSFVTPLPPSDMKWYVTFEVTNIGLTGSTVVTGVNFKPRGTKKFLHVTESALPTVTLPKTLAPGEYLNVVCEIDTIAKHSIELGLEPHQLIPNANSGHGAYRGKWLKPGLDLVEGEYRKKRAPAATGR
jgi:hypothetical protein